MRVRVRPHIDRCFLISASSTPRVRVPGVGKSRVMYGSSGTEAVPSAPVTEREDEVLVKETDGWNFIGVFPILEVCPLTAAEKEKERMATLTL